MSDIQLWVTPLEPGVVVLLPDTFTNHWVYPDDVDMFDGYMVSSRSTTGMILSFNDVFPNDVELLDYKTISTTPTSGEGVPFSFTDNTQTTHTVYITDHLLLLPVALTVGSLSFYEGMTRLDRLQATKTLTFSMENEFPRESRATDFTVVLEYTSLHMQAHVNMFNKAAFVLPETYGNVSTVYIEYRDQERTLNGFRGNVVSESIFPEMANIHFHCLCSATDELVISVTRSQFTDRFSLHNMKFIQGLFMRNTDNTLVLYNAQSSNNVFIGTQSGYNNLGGEYNVFVGNKSGENNIQGSKNAFLGYRAGGQNVMGTENVFLGTEAGLNNTGGSYNIFMGYQSGYYNTTGNYNIFMGYKAGYNNTTGRNNLFLGRRAGFLNTTGNYNVFLGDECGYFNVTGNGCTIIGTNTKGSLPNPNVDLYANFAPRSAIPDDQDDDTDAPPPTTIIQNFISIFTINPSSNVDTAIRGATGSYNTILGVGAGVPFYEGTGLGNQNTIIGSFAGEYANTSSDNTYVGYQSGRYLETSD